MCITRSLIKSKRQGGSLLVAIMKNKIRLMGIIGVEKHSYDNLPTVHFEEVQTCRKKKMR